MSAPRDLIVFAIVCLASYMVGQGFKRVRLPAITGYLVAGALAGPFVLEILPASATSDLRFVDEISLAVIAMVAGSELLIRELRPRFKAIGATAGGIIVFGYLVLALAIYLAAPLLEFTSGFSEGARLALALLGAAVLLALSPPSAIAVIKEVQARGRFTRTVLGVTVLMDVAIIVLFAAMTSVASPLLQGTSLDLSFVALLALDLVSALSLGVAAGFIISWVVGSNTHKLLKTALILALGFGIYELADWVKVASVDNFGFEVYIEPLLISLIAGLFVANYTPQRDEFDEILHDVSPLVYVAFFTITGVSLKLDLLVAVLPVAIGLFLVRALGVGLGSSLGGRLAGEPPRHRRASWLAYITQAGIALGLAREVAVQFPTLGDAFATLIVSVVVINEIAGPLFLKVALRRVGETHEPGRPPDDGKVLIFGTGLQSGEIARVLSREGREVVVVHIANGSPTAEDEPQADHVVEGVGPDQLEPLFSETVSGVISMLDDDEDNAAVIRHAAEEHGVSRLVVRPAEAKTNGHLGDHGALVVHPATGMVALLAQAVQTPNATALLLEHSHGREIIQVTVTNPDLAGVAVSDLRLPSGVLLMEIRRGSSVLLVDGRSHLAMGDELTLITDDDARAEVQLVFED